MPGTGGVVGGFGLHLPNVRVDPEGVSGICWAVCATKVSRNAPTLASYGNSVIYEVGTTYAITLVFLEWDMIAMSSFSEHLECVH